MLALVLEHLELLALHVLLMLHFIFPLMLQVVVVLLVTLVLDALQALLLDDFELPAAVLDLLVLERPEALHFGRLEVQSGSEVELLGADVLLLLLILLGQLGLDLLERRLDLLVQLALPLLQPALREVPAVLHVQRTEVA